MAMTERIAAYVARMESLEPTEAEVDESLRKIAIDSWGATTKEVPLVIYHGNCQDGFTAAWACWKLYPEWEYVPCKHGGPIPDVAGRVVYMLDFSYKRDVIMAMATVAEQIIIIDHHKTAEEELNNIWKLNTQRNNVFVNFNMNKSGAMLAWEWFHPFDTVPEIVKHVQDRDLWKFELGDTKEISMYFFSLEYDFETWDWHADLLESPADKQEIIMSGAAIIRKHDKDVKELLVNVQNMAISGYLVPVINLPYTMASDACNILCKGWRFAASYYIDKDGFYIFSLRSDSEGIDVSEIAKDYGGGGHKHAAGFKIKSLEEL